MEGGPPWEGCWISTERWCFPLYCWQSRASMDLYKQIQMQENHEFRRGLSRPCCLKDGWWDMKLDVTWARWDEKLYRPREMWKCEKRAGWPTRWPRPRVKSTGIALSGIVILRPSKDKLSIPAQLRPASEICQNARLPRSPAGNLSAKEFVDLAAAITNLSRVMLHYHVQHSQAFQINSQIKIHQKILASWCQCLVFLPLTSLSVCDWNQGIVTGTRQRSWGWRLITATGNTRVTTQNIYRAKNDNGNIDIWTLLVE